MSAPTRILHLCAGNLYGGVERIVSQCAESRDLAPEVQPHFAVAFVGRLSAELAAAGAACHVLGAARARAPWSIIRARRALDAVVASVRPAVVLCHSAWMFALAAPVLRRRDVPAVLWLHDRVSGRTWVERWAARTQPRLVICNSAFTAASLPHLFPSARSAVLYAPVAASPRLPAAGRVALRQALGAPDDRPVVLIASRMEAWKGHRDLLAALARVEEPWQLWIAGGAQKAGERAYCDSLRAQTEALGVRDRVQLLGDRCDVAALMQAADLHCQPNSGPEPFGIAFVEALYAGLPVVATDIGGAREIVTPECGVLVPPSDTGALAAALARLLADPAPRRTLGAAGPSRAAALCDPARQLARLGALARLESPVEVPA